MENYRIHHLALRTSDINKSLQFYREVLGLCETKSWGSGKDKIILAKFADGTAIELFAGGESPKSGCKKDVSGNFFHLAIETKDTDKAVAEALRHGGIIKTPPTEMTIQSSPPMKVRIAFVFGPDGEEIEFFQNK